MEALYRRTEVLTYFPDNSLIIIFFNNLKIFIMKNKMSKMVKTIAYASLTLLLGFTACTKTDVMMDTLLTPQALQTALVGSWQLVEKGKEVVLSNGHICTETEHDNKATTAINWKKVTVDDYQAFQQNGTYTRFVDKKLTCQGTYSITENAVIEINAECQSIPEKIVDIKATVLILKEGHNYSKYQKMN